ncbi:Bax inhibitor-1/YccA family protein [Desulfovibrio sp. OttesenSCG-928-C06]|nr:Bax inhibitor-1/YccA family protein [Desulfovibrio sp. OttesenSCG-928-C06]
MADNMIRNTGTVAHAQSVVNVFMRGVYLWMGIGLGITAVAAWYVLNNDAFMNFLYNNSTVLFGLIIVELGFVFAISMFLNKLSGTTVTLLFVAYSLLSGITLAPILALYTSASLARVFVACAAMFGGMSVYGLVTKRDLTSWGSFLFMGLIGIIVASLINMFLKSPAVHYIISYVGVLVFLGLTAYDTQKLRVMGESAPHDDRTAIRRATVYGALTLYLDFINLFLMLLRIAGDRR